MTWITGDKFGRRIEMLWEGGDISSRRCKVKLVPRKPNAREEIILRITELPLIEYLPTSSTWCCPDMLE